MTTTIRASVATGACLLLSVAAAVPSQADNNVHVFSDDLVWSGGCQVSYTLGARAAKDYRTSAVAAFKAITSRTGIAFARVPKGDSTARLRINVDPEQYFGFGGTDGSVSLPPAKHVPDWRDTSINRTLLVTMFTHEVLHTFGLDHDLSGTTEPEVMHPLLDTSKALTFGPSDIAGMTVLAQRNGCTPTDTSKPPKVGPVASISQRPEVTAMKQYCRDMHGTYDAKKNSCRVGGRVTR